MNHQYINIGARKELFDRIEIDNRRR